jgi:coenzyme F420 hydrogenase subunit beta
LDKDGCVILTDRAYCIDRDLVACYSTTGARAAAVTAAPNQKGARLQCRRFNRMTPNQPSNTEPSVFGTVVDGGYCIGCGACAAFSSKITMKMDTRGRFVAERTSTEELTNENDLSIKVCPFADGNPNEDELSSLKFGNNNQKNSQIGQFLGTYAGHVVEGDYREFGSSGGIATWLSVELLRLGLVDAVVHVGYSNSSLASEPLFGYAISRSANEIRDRAKTRYYPVEMSGVLPEILSHPGRYAIVGVPCFIKAVRLASLQSETLRERILFTIGIVCGHLKSSAFSEMLAWQCGVQPSTLRTIDFRAKLKALPASNYGVKVTGGKPLTEVPVTRPVPSLYGTNWGWGFFKYKACDFCDDVVAETADISLGDAWLPEYASDSAGTSIVIVRSKRLYSIIHDAMEDGRLCLASLSPERVATSQDAGLRHRRRGLAYRLWLEDQAGRWRPAKRVSADSKHLTKGEKEIVEQRTRMAVASHDAFAIAKEKNDFSQFISIMQPLIVRYSALYKVSITSRIMKKIKSLVGIVAERFVKTSSQL